LPVTDIAPVVVLIPGVAVPEFVKPPLMVIAAVAAAIVPVPWFIKLPPAVVLRIPAPENDIEPLLVIVLASLNVPVVSVITPLALLVTAPVTAMAVAPVVSVIVPLLVKVPVILFVKPADENVPAVTTMLLLTSIGLHVDVTVPAVLTVKL